ncbi:MAG: flavodoxin [Lachnospiraceae bacterium]|nr:flavodoxin [Lachnospiraceae bacterium]
MKKIFSFLLVFTMIFFLAACASGNTETNNNPTETPDQISRQPEPSEQLEDNADSVQTPETSVDETSTPAGKGRRILVAYFSATGTTEAIAQHAANAMEADLYEIIPAEPYTDADLNYNTDCRANREMDNPDSRPAISGSVDNMEDYEIVFIGYPIWWGEAPRIVSTFLESYDFSDKTIVTFSTSGSSSHNDRSIQSLVNGVNWITGTRIRSGATKSDVVDWIGGLGLNITLK